MTGLATFIQASAHSLPMLADGSVQMVATSPPYYGLRVYQGEQAVEWPEVAYRFNEWCEPVTVPGCDPECEHEWDSLPPRKVGQVEQTKWQGAQSAGHGQTAGMGEYCQKCGGWRGGLGMEPSPVAYIGHLILCLREWRRVLREDGTLWLNLGDIYANDTKWGGRSDGKNYTSAAGNYQGQRQRRNTGLKPKDLLGIPWMFALAARADGWYLRSAIVWAKGVSFDPDYSGSVMPGSQQDRPTSAHENIFLLTKQPRYYYDNQAVKEAALLPDDNRKARASMEHKRAPSEQMAGMRPGSATYPTRTLRNVWIVNPEGFSGAHFACWPEKLVEPMIKAGSRPSDVVLDPFSGSGTTAKVAVRLGRSAIGVDVSAEYLEDVTAQRFGAGVQMELVP